MPSNTIPALPYSTETYNLPTAIFVAFSTNRAEMVRTVDPATLTIDDIKEMLRLLGDLIRDRQAREDRDAQLVARIEELETLVDGYLRNMRRIADSLLQTAGPSRE